MTVKVNSFKELETFIVNVFGKDTAKALTKSMQNSVYKDAKDIVSDVKRDHPWEDKTGAVTSSQRAKKVGKLNSKLFSRNKIASYLYHGTKRHRVPLFGDSNNMVWVSGVWAGKVRTGRATGTRSTPRNAKEKYWFEKRYRKKRTKILKNVNKVILKEFGLRLK